MTNTAEVAIIKQVEVVTEYGLRTPDGETHWGTYCPNSDSETYDLHPAATGKRNLNALAWELGQIARHNRLDGGAILAGHVLLTREITRAAPVETSTLDDVEPRRHHYAPF
ncbi:hypothetical protein O4215_20485 [Rhodococcus maanshanensis]|uniref:DUF7316 family protein n=1 Tax=Rhodococcus maanshanensis TaxID=183556 RepID=UPI0022B4D554|nr:hypothetical protein [Rhodococcus maanshanensis]MCZ4557942.1 hypothetical protein [Rhodococcus maanshanensis]